MKVGGISNLQTEHQLMALSWGGGGCYDQLKTEYLVKGFTEGFHLRLDSSVEPIAMEIGRSKSQSISNHKSARVNPVAVEEKNSGLRG